MEIKTIHHCIHHTTIAINKSLLLKISKTVKPVKIKDFGKRTCFELMTINNQENFLTFTISQKLYPTIECVIVDFYLSDIVFVDPSVETCNYINDYLSFSKFQFEVLRK